jgi:protein-S-isoprenylcysteine O-methyltransferase Ste14
MLMSVYYIYMLVAILLLKYMVQYYYGKKTRENVVVGKCHDVISSRYMWLLSIFIILINIVFGVVEKYFLLSFIIGSVGAFIGVSGIVSLGKDNYNENVVAYDVSYLNVTGIYSYVRNPIRLGVCLEVLSFVVISREVFSMFIYFVFLYVCHKRTVREERFLENVFGSKMQGYREAVPRYNIIRGIYCVFYREIITIRRRESIVIEK